MFPALAPRNRAKQRTLLRSRCNKGCTRIVRIPENASLHYLTTLGRNRLDGSPFQSRQHCFHRIEPGWTPHCCRPRLTTGPVTLELDGKSSAFFMEVVDLDELLTRSYTCDTGQTCYIYTRILAPAYRDDEVVDIATKTIAAEGLC